MMRRLLATVLVAVPLAACLVKVSSLTSAQFLSAVWTERARAAYLLTFGVSVAAVVTRVFFGHMVGLLCPGIPWVRFVT